MDDPITTTDGDLSLRHTADGIELHADRDTILLTPDQLRWICLVAGPAILNRHHRRPR